MPPEGKYTSLPPRPQRDPYRSAPSPLARGSPTVRLSKHSPELPPYPAAYPDGNESRALKLRSSGEEIDSIPVTPVDVGPDRYHVEVVSPLSNTQQAPPRLQKSHIMPPGYVPQAQTTASMPHRVPLNRDFSMQWEHEYSNSVEKHRLARRRRSFDEEDDYYPEPPIQRPYHDGSEDRGVPSIIDAKYKDPYAAVPAVSFLRVKTAPRYEPEHITTSRRYNKDDEFYDDSDDDSNREPYQMPIRHSAPRAPRYPRSFPPPPPPPPLNMQTMDTDYDDGDPSDSASAVGLAHRVRPLGRSLRRERREERRARGKPYLDTSSNMDIDSDIDSDSDSDDSRDMSMPDTSRTLATSLHPQTNSGRGASHGGLSRGRQLFRPMKARRLAGVANRGTISKDNTIGDEARTADILANGGKKICKMPQSMKKLPPIETASLRSAMEELYGRAADSPEVSPSTPGLERLSSLY